MRLRSLRQPSPGYPSHQIATNLCAPFTVRPKNEQFTLGNYDRQNIKVYASDVEHMNFVDAMLKHFISNAFEHKKIEGKFLEHLDYSTVRLADEFNGAIGRCQIRASLQRLHKMGFIHLGERPNTKRGVRSGRRIRPGVNFVREDKYQSTLFVSLDILKKYNPSAAIYHAIVRNHCPDFADLVKTNPRAQSSYDIVSTDQINKTASRFLTKRQMREIRPMLIKGGDLHKMRSRNRVDGQRSKQYLYTTSTDALKTYSGSKFFNYQHPDSTLTRINDLGITYKEHLTFFQPKSHNPKNCTPRYDLYFRDNIRSKHRDWSNIEHVDNSFDDYNDYCLFRKQEHLKRQSKRKPMHSFATGHVNADLNKIPTTNQIIMLFENFGGNRETALKYDKFFRWKYIKRGKLTVQNYIGLIRNAVKRGQKLGKEINLESVVVMGCETPDFLKSHDDGCIYGDDNGLPGMSFLF